MTFFTEIAAAWVENEESWDKQHLRNHIAPSSPRWDKVTLADEAACNIHKWLLGANGGFFIYISLTIENLLVIYGTYCAPPS